MLADCAAAMVAIERLEARKRRDQWAAERADVEAIEDLCDQLSDLAEAVAAATLIVAGYHQHKRQWRLQRD